MKRTLLLIGLLLTGCAQLPPGPHDAQAKRYEAVPDKAVIYIVRSPLDSYEPAQVFLENYSVQIPTLPGTYYRWETTPGAKRLTGVPPSSAAVSLNVEAGKVYFVEFTVNASRRGGITGTALRQVGEPYGKTIVGHAALYP